MIITEEKPTTFEQIVDVRCDICGCSCFGDSMDLYAVYNDDMEEWSAQVCRSCVDEKLEFIKFRKRAVE